jgi:glycosyltransferase involved in cell wall biosynthesis
VSRVFFWTASQDGSSHYRATLPSQALTWLGHTCLESMSLNFDTAMTYDAIVASRLSRPGALDLWGRLAELPIGQRPRLVLDLDDDYFHVQPENTSAFQAWDKAAQARLARALSLADVTTLASEKLWSPYSTATEVIPNGLHAGLLQRVRDYDPETVTIGWAGSGQTAPDFQLAARAISMALITYGSKVRLKVIGMGKDRVMSMLKNVNPERVMAREWIGDFDEYIAHVGTFDIQLAPYSSNPFNNAKFPTKALEAGMHGTPLIASATYPYLEWNSGQLGAMLLVHQEHQWTRHLRSLLEYPEKRRMYGDAARGRASRNIMQKFGLDWERVLFS